MTLVIARNEHTPTGVTTGITEECEIEDCMGELVEVKWDNGQVTWPCSSTMDRDNDIWVLDPTELEGKKT